jgi:hypothetical protein
VLICNVHTNCCCTHTFPLLFVFTFTHLF